MKSRLLVNLEALIATERDPVRNACYRAQRAIYLARLGHHDEADQIVREIRDSFGKVPNGEVTAWISLAEAVNSFYRHPGLQAVDRLLRAQALSRALGHPVLQPLCSAWLAHVEFNANRMERMIDHAAEALRLAQPDHHAALSRVCLVVADAYHFAGGFELAKDWYAAVRAHALAEGDDAMISAMMFNRATLRTNRIRLADAFGEGYEGDPRAAALEVESVRNYDSAIGTLSLKSYVPLIRAQLLVAEGRYEEAISLLGLGIDEKKPENLKRRMANFLADRAWCHFGLNRTQPALNDVELAISSIDNDVDADDLAVAHARIANVLRETGEVERADVHHEASIRHLRQHRAEQQTLLNALIQSFPS